MPESTDPESTDPEHIDPAGPPVLTDDQRRVLRAVLAESQAFGFLGPGSLEPQIDRSLAFASLVSAPGAALDLGSGGGIPGLVLAVVWPDTQLVLLDGSVRRCAFLTSAVDQLNLVDRVRVVAQRAEEAGRGPLRGQFDLVVARGFGPAAVTAECAAPLLRVGGQLAVAEPPGGAPERWPAPELAVLGLVPGRRATEPVALQVLDQTALCPDRFPRRVGIPLKRPLYS